MKVCLLNVLHEAYDKRVFQKVARSLVDAGYEVVSICPTREALPNEAQGVRFVFIPMAESKRGRLISLLRLVRLGRREQAEVYLAPEPESWVAALLIKLLAGGKVVFDMHEHVPTEFAKFFPRLVQGLIAWSTARFMRFFARYTDLVILTRESFETEWNGLKVPRVTVINTNHLQPACDEMPEELKARYAHRPTIIHQGQFGDVRGSYQLLEAMKLLVKELPDLRCLVVGDYVFGSQEDYQRAIENAGLAEHLLMLGTVPYDAVPPFIAVSKVGLILFQPGPRNHTLAMPHKLFDYMREGVPVVAPDFAIEVARIIQEADAGILVDVTSPEAIAEAVLHLLREPAMAARLGANGRRIVETKYHWQQDEQRLLEAFKRLEGR